MSSGARGGFHDHAARSFPLIFRQDPALDTFLLLISLPQKCSFHFYIKRLEFRAMLKNKTVNPPDPWSETQPSQAYRVELYSEQKQPRRARKGCLTVIAILLLAAAYLFLPVNHTLLILGIDRSFENTAIGRSDTNVLVAVRPFSGTASVLSVPRDLWVTIPGHGENRINAAHFFGENEQAGTGPQLAVETMEHNLNVNIDRYLRIQLERFPQVVDAMGGVDLQLESNMAGYSAGTYHLNGEQALAFVRSRAGSDDFFRMAQGQVFLKSFIQTLLKPATWPRLPQVVLAAIETVDTNIPLWQMPRLGIALLRAFVFDKIEFVIIQREMVVPWVTDLGAQVLLPDWAKIHPVVQQEFGR